MRRGGISGVRYIGRKNHGPASVPHDEGFVVVMFAHWLRNSPMADAASFLSKFA
jgi:hypothetical protein